MVSVNKNIHQTCNRPGLGASKVDLQELHREKMRNKRLNKKKQTHRLRGSPCRYFGQHRIWPKDKVAGAHNNCATSVKYRKS